MEQHLLLNSVDALVTYHGTAGIEFASMGKPVLVPDRGKYDDCGFVARSVLACRISFAAAHRGGMNSILHDVAASRRNFCWLVVLCASLAKGFFCSPITSRQDELYDIIPQLLANNRAEVAHEIETLSEWWASGHRYYHTWKMAQSDAFQLSNVMNSQVKIYDRTRHCGPQNRCRLSAAGDRRGRHQP